MNEHGLTRSAIIAELSKSVHGNFDAYLPVIQQAATTDPLFLAHLIAWDAINGQVKDSKIAIPILTSTDSSYPDELVENSLAHLALQSPRELDKAFKFSISRNPVARRERRIRAMVRRYLDAKASVPGKWMRLAARHRRSLKSLYSLTLTRAPEWVSSVLYGFYKDNDGNKVKLEYPAGSIFADIANLARMEPSAAAAAIAKWHLSPLVVDGAMTGATKAKQEDAVLVQAAMGQMSATELITRSAGLERKGLHRDAGLKETYRRKVSEAVKSKKATLKTGVAADEVEDEGVRTMLRELQERQIQAQKDAGRGIDGNWLVICDRSSSQDAAITLGSHVAAAIAKFVAGTVHLVFCNQDAVPVEATGKTLDEIMTTTRLLHATGNTSYGVGLMWAMSKRLELDGIVIVGDGGENTHPLFAQVYAEYKARHSDKEIPVYLYQTYCAPMYASNPNSHPGLFDGWMRRSGYTFTQFDFTHGQVDYYSIPNVVQTMNVSRFGVAEKIMATKLLTIDEALALSS